jgi:hypothetical protein
MLTHGSQNGYVATPTPRQQATSHKTHHIKLFTTQIQYPISIMISLPNQLTSSEQHDDSSAYHPTSAIKCTAQSNCQDHFDTFTTDDESESSHDDFALNASFEAFQAVRFAQMVTIQTIPRHVTYTRKERSRCWYSTKDLEKMETKREQVIARMEAGRPETEGRPYRGLEASAEEGDSRVAILDEQDSQCIIAPNCSRRNEEHIAFISKRISSVSVREALRAAQEDEQEATAICFIDDMRSSRP